MECLTLVLHCSASYFTKLPHFLFDSSISGIPHLSAIDCAAILKKIKIILAYGLVEYLLLIFVPSHPVMPEVSQKPHASLSVALLHLQSFQGHCFSNKSIKKKFNIFLSGLLFT